MGKTINTILNLTDKFTPKLSAAGKQTLIFKQQLKNCNSAADGIDRGLSKLEKTTVAVGTAGALALGAFATSVVNTYKDFQQSMSNVAGILSVDATSDTYKSLSLLLVRQVKAQPKLHRSRQTHFHIWHSQAGRSRIVWQA